ncbi:MAG: hypothetical protein ACREQ3_05235 [Candidatus Binatia bacterium]
MAEKAALISRLNDLTEMQRNIWFTLAAVGGGTTGLLLGDLGIRRAIFAIVGLAAMVALIVALRYLRGEIRHIIERLREVE